MVVLSVLLSMCVCVVLLRYGCSVGSVSVVIVSFVLVCFVVRLNVFLVVMLLLCDSDVDSVYFVGVLFCSEKLLSVVVSFVSDIVVGVVGIWLLMLIVLLLIVI